MLTIQPSNRLEKYLCDQAFETATPISGTFELLPICNMDCKMCYIRISPEEMSRQGKMLSAKQWVTIAEQAAKEGTMFLLLTGGEPLLHPEFAQIYTEIRKLGIIVTINTNGTLMTDDIITLLSRDRPRRVNVSLYGSSNDVYEKLCGNPHGYTQTMHGIQRLLDADIAVKLNFTLTPYNREELESVIKISEKLQIPISIPTYMFPPARKPHQSIQPAIKQTESKNRLSPEAMALEQLHILQRNFGQAADFFKNIQSILDEINALEQDETIVEVPGGFLCTAGVSSFWVNWKGQLTACGMLEQPSVDLEKAGFQEAWEKIKQKSKQVRTSGKCFHCKYRKVCHACGAAAFAETGSCSQKIPYLCKFASSYEEILKNHMRENSKEAYEREA